MNRREFVHTVLEKIAGSRTRRAATSGELSDKRIQALQSSGHLPSQERALKGLRTGTDNIVKSMGGKWKYQSKTKDDVMPVNTAALKTRGNSFPSRVHSMLSGYGDMYKSKSNNKKTHVKVKDFAKNIDPKHYKTVKGVVERHEADEHRYGKAGYRKAFKKENVKDTGILDDDQKSSIRSGVARYKKDTYGKGHTSSKVVTNEAKNLAYLSPKVKQTFKDLRATSGDISKLDNEKVKGVPKIYTPTDRSNRLAMESLSKGLKSAPHNTIRGVFSK